MTPNSKEWHDSRRPRFWRSMRYRARLRPGYSERLATVLAYRLAMEKVLAKGEQR